MIQDIFTLFDNGMLADSKKRIDLGSLEWNAHQQFAGVYLKNVVTADQTGGLFTCLLVRIEPGHAIGLHIHPSSVELHEVIKGDGVCHTEQGDIPYAPGTMAILPANAPHEVKAGGNGLFLFAKFITVKA